MARFYEPHFVVLKTVHLTFKTSEAVDVEEGESDERFVPVTARVEGKHRLDATGEIEGYSLAVECGEWLVPAVLTDETAHDVLEANADGIVNNAGVEGLDITKAELTDAECSLTYDEA